MGAEQAYERMAGLYDAFTAHHDYELWLGNLIPAAERAGLAGRRALDIGCGTGKSFVPLRRRGWQVTACDISPRMLERARERARGRVRLLVADARALPALGRFDLVYALDDVVNYLADSSELESFLCGAARNLAPGGLVLFDANTLQTYRTFFAEETTETSAGLELTACGRTSPDAEPGVAAEIVFEAREHSGAPAMEPSLHRQRHHPPATVIDALGAAGLDCVAVYGHDEDAVLRQPLDELAHAKAIYIARARSEGR